jgi:hypothetical protein
MFTKEAMAERKELLERLHLMRAAIKGVNQ